MEKTQEEMIEALEDRYSVILYEMNSEQLAQEYDDKILASGLRG